MVESLAAPGMITLAALNRGTGLRHGFFTREGGCSEGGYAALNCGFSTGDDPVKVQANRDLAVQQLDLAPDRLAAVKQIHSNRVVVIDESWRSGQLTEADGLVTKRRGVALGILGADCAPILLADETAGVIGACHAGWRGALSGILDNTVAAMVTLGARPDRILAAIGPCIAQASYEVGPDFPAPFLAQDAGNAVFFAPSDRDLHHRFDLPGYIAHRLGRLALAGVTRTRSDTFQQEDRFFSHRRSHLRGEAACGRMLSAIALEG